MFYEKKKNKRRLVPESGTTSYLEQRNNWRGPKKTNHQKDSRKFGFGIKKAYTSVFLFVCLLVCFLRGEGRGIAIVIIITMAIVIVIIVIVIAIVIAIARFAIAIAIVIAIVVAIA